MRRNEIINWLLPGAGFPLWVPLLTHYRREGGVSGASLLMMACHVDHIANV
jgi:hypothetical protein